MGTKNSLAGVPGDLTPAQFEQWSNDLVAFLNSDGVPQQFRQWARAQAEELDANLASGDIDDEEANQEPMPLRPAAQQPARSAPRKQSPAGDGMMVLQVPAQTGKLLLGIVIGVIVLGGVFAVRQATSGDGDGASLPTNADAPAFDEARASELQQLIEQDPANQDAIFELGEMNFQAGRYEDTTFWFTKLVELDPANKHALTDLGTAAYNTGDAVNAKIWWEKVLAIDPNDVQTHYNLGFMYANVEPRDLAGAVREWETVLALDPESQLAQTARVHIDGLKAELVAGTPAAGGTSQPGTPGATAPAATP